MPAWLQVVGGGAVLVVSYWLLAEARQFLARGGRWRWGYRSRGADRSSVSRRTVRQRERERERR